MGADWVRSARVLVESISEFTHVVPRERWRTDRLLEFVFEPSNPMAATMELLASSDQMFFFAGRGARVEMVGPEHAANEVEELARAIAAGRLTEVVGRRRVRFVISLGNGTEISGSSSLRTDRQDEIPGEYHYARYPEVG